MGDPTPPVERAEEEDHDLLTFNEVGARLLEEAHELEAKLGDLEKRANTGETGLEGQIATVRTRIAALRERHQANQQMAQDAPGAHGFLNYRPEKR